MEEGKRRLKHLGVWLHAEKPDRIHRPPVDAGSLVLGERSKR